MSKNRIRPFWGELFSQPVALEASFADCGYDCRYCTKEDALVWMGDGHWKAIGEIVTGDVVMGWERGASGRSQLVESSVLDVFRRTALVQRVVLESGRSVEATPDHHWFTGRPEPRYAYQHAKVGRPLVYVAEPVSMPAETEDYQLGYVRGLADGDGSITDRNYVYPDRSTHVKNCRVACKDAEPLERLEAFAFALGLRPQWGTHHHGDGLTMPRILFSGQTALDLFRGEPRDTDEYWRGWLAGIFDAEGTFTGTLRISQYPDVNPAIFNAIGYAFQRFDYAAVEEDQGWRLRGGRREILRFYNHVVPSLWRQIRQAFIGGSQWGEVDRVVAIEAASPAPVVSMRTSTGNYISQGYASRNCFASLNERDQDREEIDAAGTVRWITKVFSERYNPDNFDEYLLRQRHPVAISNGTDPCSPPNVRTTVQVLEALRKFNVPVELLTRGPVRGKDWRVFVDLLPRHSTLYMSITTFDPEWAKKVEAGCPPNELRLELMAQAKQWRPDIRCIAAFNPVIPEAMGDPYEYVDRVLKVAGPGVIEGVWVEPLHLRQKQLKVARRRPLPIIAEQRFQQAADEEPHDPVFWQALADACHGQPWRVFSGLMPSMIQGDIGELWHNPFVTTTEIAARCARYAAANDVPTVLVTWKAWSSWMAKKLPEVALKRGDVWSILNFTQSAGRENRHGLREQDWYTLLEVLHLLWERPELGFTGVWNGGLWPVIMSQNGRKFFAADEDEEIVAAWDRRYVDATYIPHEAVDLAEAVLMPAA